MEGVKQFVPRVNQLDAQYLDREILRTIREGLINSLQNLIPNALVKYQAEIDFLLDSIIWCLSIGKDLSTFGQQILLITYNKEKATRSRLVLHFLLSVPPKYFKEVAEKKWTNSPTTQRIIQTCENVTLVLSIINFFRFLKTGKYPTLVDYILRMDLISINPGKFRRIGYSYMTRELIWAGLMEFMGVILPLVNYRKIRRFLKTIFFQQEVGNLNNEIVQVEFTLSTLCSVCGERPTLPHRTDCGHIFCYYCIYENIFVDPGFLCPLCDRKVDNISLIQMKNPRVKY